MFFRILLQTLVMVNFLTYSRAVQSDATTKLKEFIKFTQVEYADLPSSGNFPYIPYNNVPQGFAPFTPTNNRKAKVFIAVPRRSPGVPSTINYVELEDGRDLYVNPKLHSYPSFEMNELDPLSRPNPSRIVSVYRPRVDECERLWFVDSGTINTSGTPVTIQRPSIWVIDLRTDTVVNRYEIPESVARDGSGFASLTIDVIDCNSNDTFAYLPDLSFSQIVVYSLSKNTSYRVQHNYFHMHPFEGDYNVDGLKFSWDDAIFSITLSERDKDSSYRLAYFHPMSSFSEFAVSTKILRNETLAKRSYHGEDFKQIGKRGKNSQSTMHGYHQETGMMFFAEINKNAVTCWNSKNPLRPSNVVEVARNNVTMIYPSDLNVAGDDLWVMSNRMIRHIYSSLDVDDFNFRIFRGQVEEVVRETNCDAGNMRSSRKRKVKT